jgi:hypothetical protein
MFDYQRVTGKILILCVSIDSMGISRTDLLEVPTIYKAYFSGLNFRGYSPLNMAQNMLQYLHFRILEFPLIKWRFIARTIICKWRFA